LHLPLDPQTIEKADKIYAAGSSAGVSDRLRCEQRTFEQVDCGNVRFRLACTHRHAEAGTADIGPWPDNCTLLYQCIDNRGISDHHIETLTGFDLFLDIDVNTEAKINRIPGRFFKLRQSWRTAAFGPLPLSTLISSAGEGEAAANDTTANAHSTFIQVTNFFPRLSLAGLF